MEVDVDDASDAVVVVLPPVAVPGRRFAGEVRPEGDGPDDNGVAPAPVRGAVAELFAPALGAIVGATTDVAAGFAPGERGRAVVGGAGGTHTRLATAGPRGGGSLGRPVPSGCQRQPSTVPGSTRHAAGPMLEYNQFPPLPCEYDQ